MTVQAVPYLTTVTGSPPEPEPLSLVSPWTGSTVPRWVVVTNVTPYIAILDNVGNDAANTSVLGPGQANKYQWSNIRGAIGVTWINPLPLNTQPATTGYILAEVTDDPTGAELPGTYPTSPNIYNATGALSLATAGATGGNGLFCITESILDGSQFTFGPTELFRLWDWGIIPGQLTGVANFASPTDGWAGLYAYNGSSTASPEWCDSLGLNIFSSDRPQGLISNGLVIVNEYNNPAVFYLNLSLP